MTPALCGDLVFREVDGSPLRGSNVTRRLQYQLGKLGLPRIRFGRERPRAARQETGTLVFEVADDGRGFAPEASAGGAGLTSMLDRIRALGGVKRPGSA